MGGGDPKLCVPQMARSDFPGCKFRFFPRWSLWHGAPPHYGTRTRVHDRYRQTQSRSAKQRSHRKALQQHVMGAFRCSRSGVRSGSTAPKSHELYPIKDPRGLVASALLQPPANAFIIIMSIYAPPTR